MISVIAVVFSLALTAQIDWQPWSPEVFARAEAEHKFVLLDLGAVWCHWCQVMESITYRDPKVEALIAAKYIAVRADQDHHPDLANRYEEYGWPATIVFLADGSELVKRRGYMNPTWFLSMLQAIVDDPTPGPSVLGGEKTNDGARDLDALRKQLDEAYDQKFGGWGSVHKYVDADAMELLLYEASRGDERAAAKARQTLDANLALIDPQDGGVYQYSDLRRPDAPWSSPHFEKIMAFQAQNMRLYARAAKILDRPQYLATAKQIAAYLEGTLSREDGAFYASQNADPPNAIDTRVFARENGWAIVAFAELSDATGDRDEYLARALKAAKHLDALIRPAYLIDHLSAAQAYLALARSTGDETWRARAIDAAKKIDDTFRDPHAGYFTAPAPKGAVGVLTKSVLQLDENIALARLANLLARQNEEDDPAMRAIAEHAMRYLRSPAALNKKRLLAGVLLADGEAKRAPLHVTITGPADHEDVRRLYDAARSHPRVYAWVEKKTGERAIAYACEGSACSAPAKTPEALEAALRRVSGEPRTAAGEKAARRGARGGRPGAPPSSQL